MNILKRVYYRDSQHVIKHAILIIMILLLSLMVLMIAGCSGGSMIASIPCPTCPSGVTVSSNVTSTPCPTCPSGGSTTKFVDASWGVIGDLSFSKAPKPGEETQVIWSIKSVEDYKELHVWLQFQYDSEKPGDVRYLPISEVKSTMLIEGQLEWQGSLLTNEEKKFNARIKFPLEGKWDATLMFLGRSTGRDVTRTSELDRYTSPPMIGPYYEIYVSNKSPQFGYPKDYSSGEYKYTIPNEFYPFTGYVDMEKPPSLNEPIKMIWGFGSTRDISNVTFQLEFYKKVDFTTKIIPPDDVIKSGKAPVTQYSLPANSELNYDYSGVRMQSGDLLEHPVTQGWTMQAESFRDRLIKSIPLKFVSEVSFPEEGDWHVVAVGSAFNTKLDRQVGVGAYLFFNVSKNGSTWGWREQHSQSFLPYTTHSH